MKRRIYLNEYNVPTNNTIYFPFATGLLRAYAEKFENITANYEFMPFLFKREPVEKVLEKYDNPSIACFSSSMWNHQYNLKIAKLVKEKFPKCLIVFGGPQVTLGPEMYKENPFVDCGVYGEGEQFFKRLLEDFLQGKLPEQKTHRELKTAENLDDFPSPYTTGFFEPLIRENPDIEFKAIVESNRNCVFKCSFCYFGQSDLNNKIKHHSIEYLAKEVEWLATNKVKYVFCADANFGMFKRDIEIAKLYSDIKTKYGYPEKFRVCFGKNSTDTIYQTAKVLSESNLAKTVTLALQSVDPTVLKNIHRSNIKSSVFIELQKKYTAAGIPTYTEIILGLPGETTETFLSGIEFVLQSSNDNQVFIYHCQILNNTPMADPAYIEKFKMKTVKAPLAEVHGSIRDNQIERDYEYVVIETESMPNKDWQYCAVMASLIQLFYSLKVGHKLVKYFHNKFNLKYTDFFKFLYDADLLVVDYFKERAKDVSNGGARCQFDSRFGQIYWEPEEIAYLLISLEKDKFYSKLFEITLKYLDDQKIEYSMDKIKKLFDLQKQEIPEHAEFSSTEEYATKVILYGRKSNLNKPIGFQLLDEEIDTCDV